jgi:hypothetical protein
MNKPIEIDPEYLTQLLRERAAAIEAVAILTKALAKALARKRKS